MLRSAHKRHLWSLTACQRKFGAGAAAANLESRSRHSVSRNASDDILLPEHGAASLEKGIICQNCAKAWRHNRVLSANTILSRTLRCLKPRYQRRRQTQAARFELMFLTQAAPFESQCRGKARGGLQAPQKQAASSSYSLQLFRRASTYDSSPA